MRAERIARLEAPREVTDAILDWLERAHAWGSGQAYLLATLQTDHGADTFRAAMDRLMAAVRHTTWSETRGTRADMLRTVPRDATYLHSLVTTMDSTVEGAAADLGPAAERLIHGIERLFPDPDLDEGADTIIVERARRWLTAAAGIVVTHGSIDAAITALERRYLRGHRAVFPDTRALWSVVGRTMADLRSMGDSLVEVHLEPSDAPSWDPADTDLARWRRRLDLGARFDAHLRLGETAQALELLPHIMGRPTAPAPAHH
jgi:hypothetical protein